MLFVFFLYYDTFQAFLKTCSLYFHNTKQSLSKLLKLFRILLDTFDTNQGKSGRSWQPVNNSLSIIQSAVNNYSAVLHKLVLASLMMPGLTHSGERLSDSFRLLEAVAAQA